VILKPHLEAVEVMPDKRELCNFRTKRGAMIYRERTMQMAMRQDFLCRWCGFPMPLGSITFDHDHHRTKSRQDDRIEVDGRWLNAAVHYACNGERSSRKQLCRSDEVLAWWTRFVEKALEAA
jgi:hypothetical protein